MKFGAVDMESHRSVGAPYNINGYPTILLFGGNKKDPLKYESGDRTFSKFVEYAYDQLKKEIGSRTKHSKSSEG